MAEEQKIKKLEEYTGIRPKEMPSGRAQVVYSRPAYMISRKAECKVYQETECGIKICCFECAKRFVCKEFEGGCDRYTKKTYKECPEII